MGVTRLARINPGRALAAKQALATRFEFTAEQTAQMHSLITRHSLFASECSAAVLDYRSTRGTEERRVDRDLPAVNPKEQPTGTSFRQAYEWLSPSKRLSDEWQYWRVIAARTPGEAEQV